MQDSTIYRRMAVFAAVARAGSMTAAARVLGLSKAVVSTHVAELEAMLGMRLLQRTTRKQSLTEAGEQCLARCLRMVEEAEQLVRYARAAQDEPQGTLRITSASDVGVRVLVPFLTRLASRHPSLRVDLVIDDRVLDLVEQRLDLAIRVGSLRGTGSYVQRKLAIMRPVLCGAPAYLERHGLPRKPGDLVRHDWVLLHNLSQPHLIRLIDARGRKHTVRVEAKTWTNTAEALRAFLIQGRGLGLAPDYLVADDLAEGRLVALLPNHRPPEAGIYALLPSRDQVPARVRVFLDELTRALADDPRAYAFAPHH
ncbi:MAG TPA: LysR family transcriptional regulator [Haliangium sp.]|nr:LysR family transcriptional regulator [Haliangium sp.]